MDISNFIENFRIESDDQFYNPVPLKDTAFGFSIMRNIGQSGWASIFYIYINNDDMLREGNLKPLSIRVSHGKLKKDNDGLLYISLDDKDIIKKVTGPINLISKDEYYYDINLNKFYKRKNEIEPKDLLNAIYQMHTKPTRPLKGLGLRLKLLFWRVIIVNIIKSAFYCSQWLLYLISGTKLAGIFSMAMKAYPENKYQEPKKWNLFGFEAPYWPILFFCGFHFIAYTTFWIIHFRPNFVITIFRNNFLTLIYVALSLYILDSILPKILKSIINATSNAYFKFSLKGIKI